MSMNPTQLLLRNNNNNGSSKASSNHHHHQSSIIESNNSSKHNNNTSPFASRLLQRILKSSSSAKNHQNHSLSSRERNRMNGVPSVSEGLFEATTQLRSVIPILRNYNLVMKRKDVNTNETIFCDLFTVWENIQRASSSSSPLPSSSSSSLSSQHPSLNLVNQRISHISIFDEAFLIAFSTLLNSEYQKGVPNAKKQSSTETQSIAKLLNEVNETAVATAENYLLWGIEQQRQKDEEDHFRLVPQIDEDHDDNDDNFNNDNSSLMALHQQKKVIRARQQRQKAIQQQREGLVNLIKSAQKLETLYLSNNGNIGNYIVLCSSFSGSTANTSATAARQNADLDTTEEQLEEINLHLEKISSQRSFVNSSSSYLSCRLLLDHLFVSSSSSLFSASPLLGLLQFPNLKKLSLSACGIRSFSTLYPVKLLPNLEHLNLEGNPLYDLCQMFSSFSSNNSRMELIRFFFCTAVMSDNSCNSKQMPSSTTKLKSLDGKIISAMEKQKALALLSSKDDTTAASLLPPRYLVELYQSSIILNAVATKLSMNQELKYGLDNKVYYSSPSRHRQTSSSKKSILRRALRVVLLLTSLSRCPPGTSTLFDLPNTNIINTDASTSDTNNKNNSSPFLLSTLNETCLLLLQTKITKQLQKKCIRQLKLSKSDQVTAQQPTWADARKDVENELRDGIEESITIIVSNHIFGSSSCNSNRVSEDDEKIISGGSEDENNHKPLIDSVVDVCRRWPNLLLIDSKKQQPQQQNHHHRSPYHFTRAFHPGIPLYHDFFFHSFSSNQFQEEFSSFVFEGVEESVLAKFPRLTDAVDMLYEQEFNEMVASVSIEDEDENNNSSHKFRNQHKLPPLSSPAGNLSGFIDDAYDDENDPDEELFPMSMMNDNNSNNNGKIHHRHRQPLATLTDDDEDENENEGDHGTGVLAMNESSNHHVPRSAESTSKKIEHRHHHHQEEFYDESEDNDNNQDEYILQLESAADEFYNFGLLKRVTVKWFKTWCKKFDEINDQIRFLRDSHDQFRLKHLFEKWMWRRDKAEWQRVRQEEESEEIVKQLEVKRMKEEQQKFLPPLSPTKNMQEYDSATTSNNKKELIVEKEDEEDETKNELREQQQAFADNQYSEALLEKCFSQWKRQLSHRMSNEIFKVAFQNSTETSMIDYFVEEKPTAIDEMELHQACRNAYYSTLLMIEKKDSSIIAENGCSPSRRLKLEDEVMKCCLKRWRLKLVEQRRRNGSAVASSLESKNNNIVLREEKNRTTVSLATDYYNRAPLPRSREALILRKVRRQTWKAFCHGLLEQSEITDETNNHHHQEQTHQHHQSPPPKNPSTHHDQKIDKKRMTKKKVIVVKRGSNKTKLAQQSSMNNNNSQNETDHVINNLPSVSKSTEREPSHEHHSPSPKENHHRHDFSSSFVSEDLIALASKILNSSSAATPTHQRTDEVVVIDKSAVHNDDDDDQDQPLPPPSCDISDIVIVEKEPQHQRKQAPRSVEKSAVAKEIDNHTKDQKTTDVDGGDDKESLFTIDDDNNSRNEEEDRLILEALGETPTIRRRAPKTRAEVAVEKSREQRQQVSHNLRNLHVVLAFHQLAESLAKTES